VDGSLNFNDARQVVQQGADVLVLGTKTAFRAGHTYAENCQELREYLRTA
jgi:pentose-5-phosphate-3-epimerase